jgi:hypothetical protein
MIKCENLNENCLAKNCLVLNKITIDDINKFFDITNAIKCNTKIIYLNRYNNGEVLSELYVKKLDEDCHIFYTIKNNYYYIYPQFIQNILLWSKHPQAFGKEGRLGNHISIGSKNGIDIDIHETIYTHIFSNKGHTLIADKIHCDYVIGSDNKTLISNNCHLNQLAQILWDDICCSVYSHIQIIGGVNNKNYNNKTYNIIVKNKIKKPKININNLLILINNLINKVNLNDNEKVFIIKLPYIRSSQLKLIIKNISKLDLDRDISIITNSYCKCSVLYIPTSRKFTGLVLKT